MSIDFSQIDFTSMPSPRRKSATKEVSFAVRKYKAGDNHSLEIMIPNKILEELRWKIKDKIEFSYSPSNKLLKLERDDNGYTLNMYGSKSTAVVKRAVVHGNHQEPFPAEAMRTTQAKMAVVLEECLYISTELEGED